jgi:hypothetical protein
VPHKATIPQPAKAIDFSSSAAHIACWDSVIPWCNLVLAGFSVITYHVMGCMGTGVHLTTGVSASKLGLASMRSSPAAPGGYCFRAVH